jgi:hypothetical protein
MPAGLRTVRYNALASGLEIAIGEAKNGTRNRHQQYDDDGQAISGSYRVAAGVIHVTLSDGTTSTVQLGDTPAPTQAKIILQELARKSRGVS